MHRPTDEIGLQDDRRGGHPALETISGDEVFGERGRAQGLLAQERSPRGEDPLGEPPILGRVYGVEAVRQNGDGVSS